MPRFLFPLLFFALLAGSLQAQVQVGIRIKRRLYVVYEPLIVTVAIRNLSGRDLPLADEGGQQWFSFQVLRDDNQPVPPLNPNYQLPPLIVPAGQTVERTVNLNTLYPLHDFGLYRIRANLYFSPRQQYFQSPPVSVEISEGRKLWQQEVGIPEGSPGGGGTRRYSVLSFRQPAANYLYIRVEDVETGMVYATFPVGRLISGMEPQIKLDLANTLNVLQVTGPKTYLYTQVGLNGELMMQDTYYAEKTRPTLKLDKTGRLSIVGGRLSQGGPGPDAPPPGVPKLSDRPVELPKF